jgi:hypothetical protein
MTGTALQMRRTADREMDFMFLLRVMLRVIGPLSFVTLPVECLQAIG